MKLCLWTIPWAQSGLNFLRSQGRMRTRGGSCIYFNQRSQDRSFAGANNPKLAELSSSCWFYARPSVCFNDNVMNYFW
ncbi:hypothetical protein Hamer_G032227, partial [Homarus americanus]